MKFYVRCNYLNNQMKLKSIFVYCFAIIQHVNTFNFSVCSKTQHMFFSFLFNSNTVSLKKKIITKKLVDLQKLTLYFSYCYLLLFTASSFSRHFFISCIASNSHQSNAIAIIKKTLFSLNSSNESVLNKIRMCNLTAHCSCQQISA